MVIKNCLVTQSDVNITNGWDISNPANLHTGVDIPASSVFSMCEGVVIQIGTDNGKDTISVIVQYNAHNCVRYSNMLTCDVALGQAIPKGTMIGTAKSAVHFEYLTTDKPDKVDAVFPVRVSSLEYFKHDPTPLLLGEIVLPSSAMPNVVRIYVGNYNERQSLSDAEADEFDDGRDPSEISAGGVFV